MLDFLKDNWRLLVEAILVIISFVFCVFRKKPIKVIDTLKEMMIKYLPFLINEAEKSGLTGEDKLKYCINFLYEIFVKDTLSYSEFLIRYRDYLVDRIEEILSTPQKKGE